MKIRYRFKFIKYFLILISGIFFLSCGILVFGRIDKIVKAYGFVRAKNEIPIYSKIDGTVDKLFIKEGQIVKKGEILIKLDSREIESNYRVLDEMIKESEVTLKRLRCNLLLLNNINILKVSRIKNEISQAEISLKTAKDKFKRSEELFKKKLISITEYETKKWEYKIAKSNLDNKIIELDLINNDNELIIESEEGKILGIQNSLIELKEKKELINEKIKNTLIKSPISGIVLTPQTENLIGKFLSKGEAIFSIANISELYFSAHIKEHDIKKIHIGQKANIFINAFPHHKYKIFKGKVNFISPQATFIKQGLFFDVKIVINDSWVDLHLKSNPSRLLLKPGLTGKAEIIVQSHIRIIELLFSD